MLWELGKRLPVYRSAAITDPQVKPEFLHGTVCGVFQCKLELLLCCGDARRVDWATFNEGATELHRYIPTLQQHYPMFPSLDLQHP